MESSSKYSGGSGFFHSTFCVRIVHVVLWSCIPLIRSWIVHYERVLHCICPPTVDGRLSYSLFCSYETVSAIARFWILSHSEYSAILCVSVGYLGEELLGRRVWVCSTLVDITKKFSKVVLANCTPPAVFESFSGSGSAPRLMLSDFLILTILMTVILEI